MHCPWKYTLCSILRSKGREGEGEGDGEGVGLGEREGGGRGGGGGGGGRGSGEGGASTYFCYFLLYSALINSTSLHFSHF